MGVRRCRFGVEAHAEATEPAGRAGDELGQAGGRGHERPLPAGRAEPARVQKNHLAQRHLPQGPQEELL